ncbi:long-chain acyl-CoA synthetase [Pullulanibacillus pueri]|uniref:Acyl-CoA synthetase n=1 Tax=Pullulanibacillus pueri TaxID=1437324 RepID=A0A8J2ZXW0_9BACL|nr:long-chain fatty acid--CoA ligase [Pullulanibacillus pueri]MBM7684017.1 long-chain acyl-CoA synthetase [Pullulanibacillus pueri]GGH85075.1 AMP-dependent synthetase [Pullulanibacillus pueri]
MKPKNLVEMLKRTVDRYPDKTALMWKENGKYRGMSYRTMWKQVKDCASGLAHLGVSEEDKVAILSENNPKWPISDFAISSLGAVSVPIYPTQTVEQTAFILNNAECKVAIVENEAQLSKVLQGDSAVTRIIVMYPEEEVLPGSALSFITLMAIGESKPLEDWTERWAAIESNHLATIIHTSGTTGNPKGAMLTHENFLANIEGVQFWVLEARSEDVLLSYLPLSHVFERTAGQFIPLNVGAAIAYAESLETIVDDLLLVRPTVMTSVPRLFEKIYAKVQEEIHAGSSFKKKIFNWAVEVGRERYDYLISSSPDHLLFGELPSELRRKWKLAERLVYRKIKEKVGGRIRGLISGGASLNPEIAQFFWSIDIPVMEGYGLTETAPVIAANPITRTKIGTVGKPLPNLEVKLAEDGEILVRGLVVMQGYYKDEEATAQAFDNGYFKTGDIGQFDEEGYLKVVDRKKSILILSTGKNVAPQPVENAINQSSYIEQSALIGQGRKYVTALLTPNFEYLVPWAQAQGVKFASHAELLHSEKVRVLIINEVQNYTRAFASFEQPKKMLLFGRQWTVEREEITPSLKVKVSHLERKYQPFIEALYLDQRQDYGPLQEEEVLIPLIVPNERDKKSKTESA